MNVEEASKPALLGIQAAGLSVTALLLLVIAYALQLAIRLITNGALRVELGVLAFGFLFYVCAAFLAQGTRGKRHRSIFPLANVGLHAAFLCVGWMLWRDEVPLSVLGLAIAFSALLHSVRFGFARLQRSGMRRLARHRAGAQEAALEKVFETRAATYRVIPVGAALGMTLGSLLETPGSRTAAHALAGVFATLALVALFHCVTGCIRLARDFVATHDEAYVGMKVVSSSDEYRLDLLAPRASGSKVDVLLDAVSLATGVRRVFLVHQLEQLMLIGLSVLVVFRLELASIAPSKVGLALLALALPLTVLPYYVGQLRTSRRLLAPVRAELSRDASSGLKAPAPTVPAPGAWGAFVLSAAVAGAGYSCVEAIVSRLVN